MKIKKKNQPVYVLTLTESEAKILSELANSVLWVPLRMRRKASLKIFTRGSVDTAAINT